MNRYEQQAEQTRRNSLRNSLLLWSISGILLVAALAILGYASNASDGFWKGGAVVLVVFVLVFRQVGRRFAAKRSTRSAAKPDEQSMLHLD